MDESAETLEDFAKSLSYGARSDLSFKYMVRFDGNRVGDALGDLLDEIGSLFDSGEPADLIDRAIALQSEAYRSRPLSDRYRYDEPVFVRPDRPVAESRVALFTSSGHHAVGRDPEHLGVPGMDQSEAERRIQDFLKGEPVLSEIPADADADDLVVRHGGYDVRGALLDPNVTFPLEVLRKMEADGTIGGLVDPAFSFVGACSQIRLRKRTAPAWAERVAEAGTDVVLLVPV